MVADQEVDPRTDGEMKYITSENLLHGSRMPGQIVMEKQC